MCLDHSFSLSVYLYVSQRSSLWAWSLSPTLKFSLSLQQDRRCRSPQHWAGVEPSLNLYKQDYTQTARRPKRPPKCFFKVGFYSLAQPENLETRPNLILHESQPGTRSRITWFLTKSWYWLRIFRGKSEFKIIWFLLSFLLLLIEFADDYYFYFYFLLKKQNKLLSKTVYTFILKFHFITLTFY